MCRLRLMRLFLYIFLAVLCWGYVSGNFTLSGDQTKQFLTTATVKVNRVMHLSEAVQERVAVQSNHYLSLDQIPITLQQAIVATEDARFYRHHGVDFEGIARALFINMQERQFSEGASTITQQLVKNLFLTPEKTLSRKIEEVILAVGVERRFSKEEILEMYLNRIYFGSGAYGIASAADIYFGKQVNNLTLAESALLVGLPQAPSAYSPYTNFQAAVQRQNTVLDLMVKHGFISPSIAAKAKREPIYLAR